MNFWISASAWLTMMSGIAAAAGAEPFERAFQTTVRPFVAKYCLGCHNAERAEAELNLAVFEKSSDVAARHQAWEIVRERLTAGEMPPAEAKAQPTPAERQALLDWIRDFRREEARRHAGDPGPVLARRLNSAEYNYSIRDLTGVDIQPAREFPIDPANEAGFDNSGESLTMSPALVQKLLEAARRVAEHLVLTPDGLAFAPHPVMTDTDRDKYCVNRIVDFYRRQPTNYAAYFDAAWRYQHRATLGQPAASLEQVAREYGVSPKYLSRVWTMLNDANEIVGPLATIQSQWRRLPVPTETNRDDVRRQCEQLRDDIVALRQRLNFHFPDLSAAGIHKGSQTFVLWKNRQYASHRRLFNREALKTRTDSETANDPLVVPGDPVERARHEEAFERFCDLFPDAFYVAERGRDYLGKSRDQQEKGRLLSAGFHSMMGYFRDDGPLYDLILSDREQQELDALWRELDFITAAPMRQYAGFLWFERTDSRYLRDAEFDFARSEDKNATSAALITRLSERYLAKAVVGGAQGVEVDALQTYFRDINAQIRWVEAARLAAEPAHLSALAQIAERAYRRPLTTAERDDLIAFYRQLRDVEQLSHEEALQDALVAVLISPAFYYRLDLAAAGDGVRPLTDYELASRLSFFLWSSLPDAELLDCAAGGTLHQPDVLRQQTRRMIADARIRALAVEFGGHWLDFRRFESHNAVDRERFPGFTNELRQAMFEEPVRFLIDLWRRDGSMLDCLYGRHTYVNAVLAKHYGLPADDPGEDQWVRIDNAHEYGRGGLLPMAAFLTQNSPGLRTSPVKRGYWVVRRLLGERIPPPPPTVPELPADEAQLGNLTLREALARHREHASCAACHARFDSLGLVFEGFGPVGELRTKDLGGRSVDVTATFPDGRDGAGLSGLRDYLHRSREADFLDNLCRKLLSYALGRSLQPSDDELVETMGRDLTVHDYRFSELIETIVAGPQFLRKRGKLETGE